MSTMDPRERADATLARARARGAYVVTPESAISPMDATSTQQIPRSLVSAIDRRENDPEATMVVPATAFRGGRHHAVPAQGEALQDEGPAIAQETSTQMLPSPSRPQDPALSWAPPAPPPPPEPEELDGLIPTIKQPPPETRSTLSQRLDG
jgi:hypothetical protein